MKKYSVQIEDNASLDIQEAIYYYERLSKGLGERFASEIIKAANILKLNPHFQIRYDAVRCLKVKSFPFRFIMSSMKIRLLSLFKL